MAARKPSAGKALSPATPRLPGAAQPGGLGGQFIQVIPDLDLVVVITSDAENGRDDAQQLVGEAIIPAVTG